MINSACLKNSNNHTIDKSAFFDFSKQGFSPLLFKSKISYYDHDLKEGNLNCSDIGINENFLETGLVKDKFNNTNNLNINSPFNLNYLERRNSLTKQNYKAESYCEKPFTNFSSNLNFNNNNFEKNYNFNYINTNFINQNVTFSKKYNSEEIRKEIKYADDYSFKKNKIFSDKENNENSNEESQNNLNAKPEEDILITRLVRNSLSKKGQVKKRLLLKKNKIKKGSILIENLNKRNLNNKNLKTIKSIKFNKKKVKKFKNFNSINNINNHNQNLLASINENSINVGFNKKSSSICLDSQNKDFKSFSLLKHKRKANIISSLFGSQNNFLKNESGFLNKKFSFKKLNRKKKRKTRKSEEDLDSNYSVYGSSESDSIYNQKDKKLKSIKKLNENTKKIIRQNTNIGILKKGLIPNSNLNNLNKSFKFSRKKIKDKEYNHQLIINEANNKNKIPSLQDDQSPTTTPNKSCMNKTYDSNFPINNIDIDDEFSFCPNSKSNQNFFDLKDSSQIDMINPLINKFDYENSFLNLNKNPNEISMAYFDEIFGINKITKKNRKNSVKKIKNIVDSKTCLIQSKFLNFENDSEFHIENIQLSKHESLIDSSPLQIHTLETNEINSNQNKEYLYESFDDDDKLKQYSTFCNNKIKDNMIEIIVWGKPNNKKLSFGECPLSVFADIYQRGKNIYSNFRNNFSLSKNIKNKENIQIEKENFFNQEFEQEALDLLAYFTNTMREISIKLSTFPVFNINLKFHQNKLQKNSNLKQKKISATNITEKIIKRGRKKKYNFNPEAKIIHELFEYNKEKDFESEEENKEEEEYKEEKELNQIYLKKKFKSFKNEKSSLKAKKSSEETESEKLSENEEEQIGYDCDICGQIFSNGQGLGGHMSRKHPNQSEKYKSKKETRDRRNNKREILYKAQRVLLRKYRQDYDKLKENAEGRKLIKKICKDHKQEYYKLKKEVKSSRNMRIKAS